MKVNHDLVIRGGLIADGEGGALFAGDVAIDNGTISAVGAVDGIGREEIDAKGLLVTPGFVDVHTHFDAQATWSNRLSPSSEHGVTTVVMGNCGVGFAPCRPDDRDSLIRLMEGVEDIPGVVMNEGIPWAWETFPQFLDFLGNRQYDVDVALFLPHAPVRVYAMGKRGIDREPATNADMETMANIAAEAIAAGAMGVSTSRTLNHRSSDHQLMPGVSATEAELTALGRGIRKGGTGLLQFITDFEATESEFGMLRRVGEATGVPMTFSLLQVSADPNRWRKVLDMAEQANQDGVVMKPQVFPRPIGLILGLDLHYNFFTFSPSYQAIKDLPLAERIAVMRDPEVRRRIIAEYPTRNPQPVSNRLMQLDDCYPMAENPEYAPARSDSVAAIARARGLDPVEFAYDMVIGDDGKNVFYLPVINYQDQNLDVVATMLNHKDTLIGLGDGGAHVGLICDSSGQTYMLQRWVGDGEDGTMPIGQVVKSLAWDNARAMNLLDRGLVRPGYRADLNIIDLDRISLHRPEMVHDLPLGGGRLVQRAEGYVATLVAGAVTYRDGEPTGQLPGRLVRGAQPIPA